MLETKIAELKKHVEDVRKEDIAQHLLTAHSTRIEGNTMSISDIEQLLITGFPSAKNSMVFNQMAADHANALSYGIQNCDGFISEDLIKSISAKLLYNTGSEIKSMLGTHDERKGDYRLVKVSAGKISFLNAQKVPEAMKNFVKDLNEKLLNKNLSTLEVFEISCFAHFQLVQIHPFSDGNGRTARILQNMILLRNNLPMCNVHEHDKLDYYQALNTTREKEDLNIFFDFMLEQYLKSLENRIEKHKTLDKNSNLKQKNTKGNSGMSFSFLA